MSGPALRDAVLAGYRGDEAAARRALDDADPRLRAAGFGALDRMGRLRVEDLQRAAADTAVEVRRRAADLLARGAAGAGPDAVALLCRLADDVAEVCEAACFAAGELALRDPGVLSRLHAVAAGHEDPICRETAVAALGAIGDPSSLPVLLSACEDRATVRRRAAVALAGHGGPAIAAALRRLARDRDLQVRQTAEDLLSILDDQP